MPSALSARADRHSQLGLGGRCRGGGLLAQRLKCSCDGVGLALTHRLDFRLVPGREDLKRLASQFLADQDRRDRI